MCYGRWQVDEGWIPEFFKWMRDEVCWMYDGRMILVMEGVFGGAGCGKGFRGIFAICGGSLQRQQHPGFSIFLN